MRQFLKLAVFTVIALGGCGGEDGEEADRLGVGSECTSTDECDESTEQSCLPDFKGGYCGIVDCRADADCPEFSACVLHDDGNHYCFRTCTDKAECNENRSEEFESNCSSSIEFLEEQEEPTKACVPPSN